MNKRVKTKKGPGRPVKQINWPVVNALCARFSPASDIANELEVDTDTLDAACIRDHGIKFSEYRKVMESRGKNTLRGYQLNLAKTQPRMAEFLGINYLDQSNKIHIKTDEIVAVNDAVIDAAVAAAMAKEMELLDGK